MAGRRRAEWGQGAVRKRGNRWQAIIQIDGQRLWKGFATKSDGLDWLATVRADALRGDLRIPEKRKEILFIDAARLFKLRNESDWRPGTVSYYDNHLKAIILPAFGDRHVSKITTQEIEDFLQAHLTRGVSSGTVKKYRQCMNAVFRFAAEKNYLERSPMAGVKKFKEKPRSARAFKLHEFQAFLRACKPGDREFYTVLLFTGLRRSEIFRMTWDWVDLIEKRLHVKVAKCGVDEIPLAQPAVDALLTLGPKPDGLVFPGHRRHRAPGHPLDMDKPLTNKRASLETALKAAGVDPTGISPHSFRRTFLTLLEKAVRAPYSVVKALARHGKRGKDITARYLETEEVDLRDALQQLTDLVMGPANVIPIRARG